MPPRSDKACDVVVLEAIKGAHFHVARNFRHKCNIAASAMKATPTPGSRVNDYNNYVSNGDLPTKFLLNSNEMYGLCSNMKQKIDDALKNRDRKAAAAANNTNANPAIRDPLPGVDWKAHHTVLLADFVCSLLLLLCHHVALGHPFSMESPKF